MTHELPGDGVGGHAEAGVTRRTLFRTGAGAGAVGITAGVLGMGTATSADAAPVRSAVTAAHGEPVVAHVHDPRTGEVDMFIGTRHVRVVDHQLVHRMLDVVEESGALRPAGDA